MLAETTRVKDEIEKAIRLNKLDDALRLCGEGLRIEPGDKRLCSGMRTRRAKVWQLTARAREAGARRRASQTSHAEEARKARERAAAAAAGDAADDDDDDDGEVTPAAAWKKCMQDAQAAVYLNDTASVAYQLKAEALQALERWEEAVHELEACLHKCGKDDEGLQAKLKEAQRKHKASSRSPDLYKVLGIVEGGARASEDDIRKAYKKSAMKWHPDRFASKSAAEQEKASEQFKIISDALDVLTDPVRRKLWDQGYDRKEIEERAEMEKQRGQHRGHGGGFGGGGFPGGFPGGFGGFG